MTHRKNSRKPNGHAGPHGRDNATGGRIAANGHDPASTERGGIPVHRDQAASDDASGASVASAATSAAAGADRKACAEAAPSRPSSEKKEPYKPNRKLHADKGKPSSSKDTATRDFDLDGPTDFAAMRDSVAYVNAVAARVDLVGASVRLVRSCDDKVAKAELDRVREMIFGKVGAAVVEEEPQQVVADIDSAVARRAAQGAKK